MIREALIALAISPFLAGCLDTADSHDRSANADTDTLASGAIVVSNSSPGLWGDSVPRLVEARRIGAPMGDGRDVFGQIDAIGIAPDGLVHVLDGQVQEIRVFTPDGGYVRTIGRQGGGPGELGAVTGFSWDEDGRLWVADIGNARYSVFDAAGQYLESHTRDLAGILPWVGGFGDTGQLFDLSVRMESDDLWEFVYYAFDRSLAPTDTFPPIPYERTSTPIPLPAVQLMPRTTLALDPMGFVWFGNTDEYRITKRALAGDTARIISLARPRAEITEAVKDSVLEEVRQGQIGPDMFDRSDIPDRMPYFERLVLDGQGRAVVLALAEEGVQVLDFFDEEGRYLGTIRPPTELDALRPPVIRGDTIWAVTTDDIGAEYVTELHLDRDSR